MPFLDVVFRALNEAGDDFIEQRREDGHGSQASDPTFTRGVDASGTDIDYATETTLAALSAAQQTDALTDTELRASDVSVTLDGEAVALDAATLAALETVTVLQGTDPWTVTGFLTPSGTQDVDVVANSIGLATEATLAAMSAAQQTDALTDTELRANDVAVTLDGEAVALDAATLAALETTTVLQGTSPWVVSGTVTATPSGTQDVNIVSDAAGLATETTLAAMSAAQQTDALTDTELRASDVPVTLDGETVTISDGGGSITVDGTVTATPTGTQNVDVTGNTIGLSTEAKQDDLIVQIGEVSATPTANTVLGRLKDIDDIGIANNNLLSSISNDAANILVDTNAISTDISHIDFILNDAHDNPNNALRVVFSGTQAVSGDWLTDTELRASDVAITLDGEAVTVNQGTDPWNVDITANTIGLATEAKQDDIITELQGLVPAQSPLDPINSTQVPLTDGSTFTGASWTETPTATDLFVFALADQPLSTFKVEWSSDGIVKRPGLLAESDITPTETETGGFYIYLDTLTTNVDNYYRIVASNTSGTDQTVLEIDTWRYPGGFHGTYIGLNDELGSLSTALLTRAVSAGVNPDNEFINQALSGRHSANSTTTPLVAGDTWRGVWYEWDGRQVTMTNSIQADEAGTWFIDFSSEVSPTDGDETSVTDSLSILYDPEVTPLLRRITPAQSRWVRPRFVNGPVAQTEFSLDTTFSISAPPLVMQRYADVVSGNLLAGLVKAGITAPDANGDHADIQRFADALKVYIGGVDDNAEIGTKINEVNAEVQLKPPTLQESFQVNAVSGQATQVPLPSRVGITRAIGYVLTNDGDTDGGDSLLWSEDNTLIASVGKRLRPAEGLEFHVGQEEGEALNTIQRHYLQASGTSVTNDVDLEADTVDSNTGVVDPTNIFADDSGRAIFDSTSDTVTISGFDASTEITEATIAAVKLVLKGRKESGALGESAAIGTAGAIDAGSSTSINTPTITANANGTLIVFFARENTGSALNNVTNTMGYDAYNSDTYASGGDLLADVSNGGESRISAVIMRGTPTGNGTVSGIMSAGTNHEVAGYVYLENVKTTGILVDTYANTSTGSVTGSVNATQNGVVVQGIASEIAQVDTLETGFTQQAEDGSGANDDQTLNIATHIATTTASKSWGATLDDGTNDDATGIALSFLPADALDPVVEVSHSEGATVLEATLTSTSDAEFEIDITGDAEWTEALLDGADLTITPTTLGNADAEINQVKIVATEAGALIPVSGVWTGT